MTFPNLCKNYKSNPFGDFHNLCFLPEFTLVGYETERHLVLKRQKIFYAYFLNHNLYVHSAFTMACDIFSYFQKKP